MQLYTHSALSAACPACVIVCLALLVCGWLKRTAIMHPAPVQREHLYQILASVFLISVFFSIQGPWKEDSWSIPPECDDCFLSEVEKLAATYRQCLLNRLQNNEISIWKRLPSTIRSCLAHEKISSDFNMTRIGKQKIRRRSRMVILPPSKYSSCIAVSAPAEKVYVERDLRQLVPKCKFHVAYLGRRPWIPGWKFYPKVISFADFGDDKWNRKYERIKIKENQAYYVSLKTFLEQIIKLPQIDYLWIDYAPPQTFFNMGERWYHDPETCFPEYSIFEESFIVTVCQVSLYTRIFDVRNGMDTMEWARPFFQNRLLSAISNSPFLPIHSEFLKKQGAIRTTFMNFSDPYCLKKYLAPTFCAHHKCKDKKLDNEWMEFQDLVKKFEVDLIKIEHKFNRMMKK